MLPSNLLTTGLQALAALSVFNVTGKDVHGNISERAKKSNLKNHKTAEEIYGKSAVTFTAPETATVPSQGVKTTTEGFRPSDRLWTNTVQEKDRYELYGTVLLPKQLQKKSTSGHLGDTGGSPYRQRGGGEGGDTGRQIPTGEMW